MADEELLKRWRVTTAYLERAREFLPENPIENRGNMPDVDLASLDEYQHFLDHNELELAMEQLEGIGELNNCPAGFWKYMRRAANIMGLNEHVECYQSRFTATFGQQPKGDT